MNQKYLDPLVVNQLDNLYLKAKLIVEGGNGPVTSDEDKIRNRMMRNAEMVQNRGLDAILCLMARGVGEDTATRILRAYPTGTERDSLLKAIHDAEIQYARTRRFWG